MHSDDGITCSSLCQEIFLDRIVAFRDEEIPRSQDED